jgi:hypothetical protein
MRQIDVFLVAVRSPEWFGYAFFKARTNHAHVARKGGIVHAMSGSRTTTTPATPRGTVLAGTTPPLAT